MRNQPFLIFTNFVRCILLIFWIYRLENYFMCVTPVPDTVAHYIHTYRTQYLHIYLHIRELFNLVPRIRTEVSQRQRSYSVYQYQYPARYLVASGTENKQLRLQSNYNYR